MSTYPQVLYFGCIGDVGHYMHSKPRSDLHGNETPWGWLIDAGLFPKENAQARVLHTAKKDGWTAIFAWDNSVDPRPGSHSTFIVHADVSTEELLRLAREQWPEVFSRPRFPNFVFNITPFSPAPTPDTDKK